MPPPLVGRRVVDLSTEIAGPYCTKLIADAGAEVVKVEGLPDGDPLRRWTASGVALGPGTDGALFRFLNTSKESLAVDWATTEARRQVLALAAGADLVVESFTPGTLEAMGLGLDALQAANPALTLLSISPFGRGGPWSDRPATEFTLQAWSGSTGSRGTPERPPLAAGGRLGEWLGGAYAALAALTMLRRARETGRGEHVDVSLLEVMATTMAPNQGLVEKMSGRPSPFLRTIEIPSIEPARDGWVGFCTITNQQWRDLLVLLERPDLADDEELARWDGRIRRVDEVNAFIHAWTRERTVAEIIAQASLLRIPVAPIGDGRTVPDFDHFRERRTFVDHPNGEFVQPGPPYRFSRMTLRPFTVAPRLGEYAASAPPARPPAPAGESTLPLAGVRIIDFTAFWAGPFATHNLAAMGADVIKIESIQRPDGMRFATTRQPNEDGWWEWAPFFHATNLGKRGITLDLTRPAGRDLALRLIARADAVVENFSPRVMENLGLDWPALEGVNPALVMVRMPAFGLSGKWRDRVGFAQTMEQISGMASVTGFADGPPVIPRGPCDPLAGMHAAIALLLALEHRRATGEGQLVEATMVEAALNAAAEQVIEWSAYGQLLARDGNRGPVAAPQNVYSCRSVEQWLALAVTTDAHWAALVAWLGAPAWASDPAFVTAAGRRDRQDALDAELARVFNTCERDEAVDALLARGIPAAAVVVPARVSENPQLRARGFFETVTHPVVGAQEYSGLPIRLSDGPSRWYRRPAPTLGEHTEEVLRELLGLSDDEITALRSAGVIGDRPAGA